MISNNWLGIPSTGNKTHIRFGEFNAIYVGRIVLTYNSGSFGCITARQEFNWCRLAMIQRGGGQVFERIIVVSTLVVRQLELKSVLDLIIQ